MTTTTYDDYLREQQVGEGLIPHSDGIYLLLSKEAYVPEAKRATSITMSGETFQLDKSLSSLRTAVYHSPTRLIIAHRGTVPSDKADLLADAAILTKTFPLSKRAKTSFKEAVAAHHKYPKLTVSNTGHSLGGATAQYVGYHFDLKNSKVVAFNPGSSPFNLMHNIKNWAFCKVFKKNTHCRKQRNQTLYATAADPIAFGKIPFATIVKAEKLNPHSMENYIIDRPK